MTIANTRIAGRRARSVCLGTLWLALATAWASADEEKTYNLNDPSEPWRSAQTGISSRVVSPYTPLVRDGAQVQCWGRSYRLGGLLPAAIIAQGQALFDQPVTLELKTKGTWNKAPDALLRFSRDHPDQIDFTGHARADAIEIGSTGSVEYDGFLRTDLTVSCDVPVVVEGLRVVFRFQPDAALFHHVEKRWDRHVYLRCPTKPGDELCYDWKPLVWVGNHDVGFTVVTETWDGWTSDSDAIRLTRRSDRLELSLDLLTEPTVLDAPRTYRFGMLATPSKPMPTDRWGLLIGLVPGANLTATNFGSDAQPLFSFPQPADFSKTAAMLEQSHKQGVRNCYYITTSATSAQAPVARRNHDDWVMAKVVFDGREWNVGSGFIGADACCPASEYADFMAWAVEQLLTHLDFDGIYIDNPGPYWCENRRHGCGAGGKPTYPFFALRDLHKRLYTIVKSHRPDGLIWEHTSETFNPLQLAWVDVYSDGEHFRNADAYPKDELRALFNRTYMEISGTGQQVGAVPAYLSSLGVRNDGDWAHWLLARTLPWGQMICTYHGWLDGSPAMAVARARSEFGLGREPLHFYRPHELPEWFHVTPGAVICCLWQRPRDGALLVVLANWADQPVTARIDRRLADHLGPFTLYDALSGIRFPRPDDFMLFSIPANSFRLIRIRPAAVP